MVTITTPTLVGVVTMVATTEATAVVTVGTAVVTVGMDVVTAAATVDITAVRT